LRNTLILNIICNKIRSLHASAHPRQNTFEYNPPRKYRN
jgi:hypothetical protein